MSSGRSLMGGKAFEAVKFADYVTSEQEHSKRCLRERLHHSLLLGPLQNRKEALVKHCRASSYFMMSSSDASMF